MKIVDELNALKINCTSYDWAESLPDGIWEKYFEKNSKELEYGLDVDTHRWFETSTTVVQLLKENVIIGINHVTNTFSESMDVDDCYVEMTFFEMEPVETITYKIKK